MSGLQELDLRLDEITKVYPGVIALQNVSLKISAGEILGLIGENGAGKSTLMKILGGLITPTAGSISIDGMHLQSLTIAESQGAGIAFVHQELNVLDNLDVAANVFLGREKTRGRLRLIDQKAMHKATQPLLNRIGAKFKPGTLVADLSLAERQLLEIAKALSLDARLVIMDEPTSSLTLSETKNLLQVVADLKTQGIAVIFISHRLGEVEECVDRIVVLRDGEVAGHLARDEISHDAMIRLMIGRDLKSLYTTPNVSTGEPILSVKNVRTAAKPVNAANFELLSGEILGVAGLIGAGRTELAQAIFGVDEKLSGKVFLNEVLLDVKSPAQAIQAGLYLVPEDRMRKGLILEFPIMENITLAHLRAYASYGMVSRTRQSTVSEKMREQLSIKTPDIRNVAQTMSGGNQQKIVLAKWLSMNPKVIIFDEPTRGIDVGSKSEIYNLLRNLADRRIGVMMISSDMEEVIGVSDRIVVVRDGGISGVLHRSDFSENNILKLAVGKELEEA